MGKGKRNKLLRVEETTGAPEKRQNKKQFIWPKWTKRAVCIVLLVAVLAGIVIAAVVNNSTALRNRIIVESKSGKYDINQQMATFIIWQSTFEYYYELYAMYLGDESQAQSYAINAATEQTTKSLNSGLNDFKDSLIQLVACADAAHEEGLKFDENDKAAVSDYVAGIQNIYVASYAGVANENKPTFEYFLSLLIGAEMKTSDIEDAAKVLVMYNKYRSHKFFELQDDPTADVLQDYILKNPADFFKTKYFSFKGADEAMIRDLFTDEFISERFESTVAKYYAKLDYLKIKDLKDDALAEKLTELAFGEGKEYTKTTTDGKDTYSDNLPEAIGEYIFSTSNTTDKPAYIAGDKCAYLIVFKAKTTADKATITYKTYTYEDAKTALEAAMAGTDHASIDAIKELVTKSILAGENVSDYMTDNDKAEKFLEEWKKDKANLEGLETKGATITKGGENTDVPASIVSAIYPKDEDATPYNGWIFVINDPNESYVVRVTDVDSENAKCVATYITYTDDLFVEVLNTFEDEFSGYLSESKTTAPTFSNKMTFEQFKEKVINWVIDENLKELLLKAEADKVYAELKTAMADSGNNALDTKLNEIFSKGVEEYEDFYSTEKALDPDVYAYIFNAKNKNTATVIVGKDDRVYLVYVAPKAAEGTNEHEGHNHPTDTTVVKAAIKEFVFDAESEENVTLRKTIYDALSSEGRKDPENFATSADKFAEDALKGFEKEAGTEGAVDWAEFETTPVAKSDTDKNYQAIIDMIYPSGKDTKAADITVETGKFYQVNDNGTSYVFKITELDKSSDTLAGTIQYKTYKDEEKYSYFRTIKSALDASFAEKVTTLDYPSYFKDAFEEWIFKNEYKDAEGDTKASLTFERQKDDLTFVVTTKTESGETVISDITIYMVDTPAVQENDTDKTVFGAYQLYETEKEANKALKELKDKTGIDLYDSFSDLVYREKLGYDTEVPGYVYIQKPYLNATINEDTLSNEKLKEWFFDGNRKNNDVGI